MYIWGVTKKYKGLSWFENFLGGHLSIGGLTVYGENAMHWGVNIRTKKWGYICFRLPFRCFGKWWPLYFYLSPNATPWAATYYVGTGHYAKKFKEQAVKRKVAFGHNFSTDKHWDELKKINNE
jgi:hypothetical protein